jgi:D-threo-aldose 1-dehydrogenase
MSVDLIGLGFGLLGTTNMAPISDSDAQKMFSAAWELGVRRFDTAPLYGGGLSEERLGKLLADHPRDAFVLSSKTGRFRPYANAVSNPKSNPSDWYDYSAATTRRSIENSLERLGTDRLDIAFVHDCDVQVDEALKGALPELRRMQEEGIVGLIGCGSNLAETHEALLRSADLDILMVAGRLTLLDHSAATTLLPLARDRGVTVELAAPFNSGILAAGPDDPHTRFDYANPDDAVRQRAREIAAVCEGFGVSLRRAALHYPLQHPAVSRLILGLVHTAGLKDNVFDLEGIVPEGLWSALSDIGIPDLRPSA